MHKVIFLLLILFFTNFAVADNSRAVETYTIKKEAFSQQVSLIGTLTAKQELNFSAKLDGLITKINKSDGSLVVAGDIILEMENDNSKRAFEASKKTESIASQQYQNSLTLFKKGFIGQFDLNEKQQKWNIEQQNLAKFKKEFEDSILKAPFNGKLGVFQVKVGSYVKTGDKIVTLYTPEAFVIDLNIPESVLSQVHEGAKVLAFNQEFSISSLQRAINPNTLMADARVDLANLKTTDHLYIGKPVTVTVILNEQQDALVVPKVALFIQDGKNKIFKVKDGKAVLTEIEVGLQNKDIMVINKGVEEGDSIILYGQSYLQSGDAVTVYQK